MRGAIAVPVSWFERSGFSSFALNEPDSVHQRTSAYIGVHRHLVYDRFQLPWRSNASGVPRQLQDRPIGSEIQHLRFKQHT